LCVCTYIYIKIAISLA